MKTRNKLVAIAMLLMLFVIVMPAMVEKASASGALGGIWHFDEGTGTTTYDSSGNGNHGTVHGVIWTDGKIGKALEFDGVNDYVNVPDSNSLDITGKITLEAWIYPYTVTTMQVIVQKYNYSGPPYNGAYYLGIGGYGYNNKILFGLSNNGYNFYYILSNTNIAANTWTHVAATSNGTHMIIYINGIKDKVATYPPGVIYASTAPLRIGCFLPELGVSRFFNGLIDEVRVSSGTIWTVDDDRVQCPNADFTNIQAAVNKASPDDTIIVHDGTYDEQVIINKSLTVQGTGSTPVIKPSSAAQLTTILDGRYWGGTKQIAGIIIANVADGSNVTVKNLVVDGENVITKPTGADYVAGIFYRETGGLIDALTIANMTIDVSGTAVRGYGIYLSAVVNTVSVEVKDCNITNYDKNGVNAHGDKLTVNIHYNTITGRGPLPSGDEVQNGICIMDSAIATVNSNTISNMAYIPESWWSAGILFLDGGTGCSANYNTINDCQIGIVFNDMSGSATGNTVNGGAEGKSGLVLQQSWGTGTWTASFVGNIVSGCDTEGIGVHSYDADTSITATVDNNQLNGGLGDGIFIGDIPDYSPAGNITVIITNNNVSNWRLGIRLASSVIGATITGNRITDFIKGGIVTRSAKNIFIKGNTISTTLHDEAPNGIDVGTYSGTTGTIRENEISGCSWNGFTGDYEASWSGSGILVIESADSLQILANIVHDCDVGMDIESDLTNITYNDVHNNIYGFIFWNANPKVNYDNIYSNTKYGVYRTALGNLTGALDARYNWWGDISGPTHSSNTEGTGDAISDNADYSPWLGATFATTPRTYHVNPTGAPGAIQEAIDEAASGDTIIVHDGTYNEGLYINGKSLTIKADSTPVIQGSQLFSTNYGTREAVVFVENAENVVLDGLDIEGLGFGSGLPKSYGVIYEESSGIIRNCIVSTNMIGDMYDVGIAAWDSSTLAIEMCTVKNFGRIGVFYYNGCTGGVSYSVIEGQVYNDENLVNYGIEVEPWDKPCSIEIFKNEIYNCNNLHASPLWSSAGILIDGWHASYELPESTVTILGNEIHNNYYGIEVVANQLSYAHYNSIYDNKEYGVIEDPDFVPNDVPFDATLNWWGDTSGPYHGTSWIYMGSPYGPHYGLGDNVSDYVLYYQWLSEPSGPPVEPPTARFTYLPSVPKAGETVTFDASTSAPNGGTIIGYKWGFGDGNTTTTTDALIVHVYDTLGTYNVTLTVTDSEGLTDSTWQEITVIPAITIVHDVAVTDVAVSSNIVYQGWIVDVNVTVANLGNATENFTVTLYYDNTTIATHNVQNLEPNATLTLRFAWNTTNVPYCHNYTIKAVASTVSGEINVDNNTFIDGTVKIKIMGDINGDGKVDIKDLVLLIRAFGSYSSHPRWNSEADFNGDNKVDIKDLVLVIKNFGKTC